MNLLLRYSMCSSETLRLRNTYQLWTVRGSNDQQFTVQAYFQFPEQTFLYPHDLMMWCKPNVQLLWVGVWSCVGARTVEADTPCCPLSAIYSANRFQVSGQKRESFSGDNHSRLSRQCLWTCLCLAFRVISFVHMPAGTAFDLPAATRYRTGFWQLIKFAWVQYLSLFLVFLWIFNGIRRFIFSNGLVSSARKDV